jgi:hypothetical protein
VRANTSFGKRKNGQIDVISCLVKLLNRLPSKILARLRPGNLGPYSQHFTFFLAYEVRSKNTPNKLVLQYTRLERLARGNIIAHRHGIGTIGQ